MKNKSVCFFETLPYNSHSFCKSLFDKNFVVFKIFSKKTRTKFFGKPLD